MATITLSNPVCYKTGSSGATEVVGYESSSNRVLRYSFKTPAEGASSVSFSFSSISIGNGSKINIRFFIGTSATSHTNAGASSQYTGTLTFTDSYTKANASANILLLPNTTYYLWLFPAVTTFGWYDWDVAKGSLVTSGGAGLVYIDNGSKFEPYQCYIDNGTSWDLCLPYIDNGTEFVLFTG